MRRREFITLLGGAGTWPLAARTQPQPQMRRVGVLTNFGENDPEGKRVVGAFRQHLQELGWIEGRTAVFDHRWTGGDPDRARAHVAELAGIRPDVILVAGGTALSAMVEQTRSIATVFVSAADPVELELVASLARPGGNATGFTSFEQSMGTKWLGI